MTRVRHGFVLIAGLILLLTTAASLTGRAATTQDVAQASTRIVAAANVTLRALPSATSVAVAQLPLGTEVTEAGPAGLEKTWVRVKLVDGREGWLLANLTKPLDPAWRWPAYDRIIAERLGRQGDGFSALAELVAFVEHVAPEYTDRDGRARIDLARLRAMSAALGAVSTAKWTREPYASWLKAHNTDVVRNEVAGSWMLSNAAILNLHTRHATTSSADDIAWLAVTNGLAGECEGHLTCYLEWHDHLQGEYLRRQPAGQHADEAVGAIKRLADEMVKPRQPLEAYEFDRERDCRDLAKSVDALTAAVKATRAANRDATLASLATLRRVCQ